MTLKTVNIQIMDKHYAIQCPEAEEARLHDATQHINQTLSEIRRQMPNLNSDKLMMLTTLQICEQLFEAQKNAQDVKQSSDLLEKMLLDVKKMVIASKKPLDD